MKNVFFSIICFLFAVMSASALTVNVERAGTLAGQISGPASVSELVVTGEISAPDIEFIANEMPALRSLDLSRAEIVRYVDTDAVYPANRIPQSAFAGSQIQAVAFPATAGLVIGDAAFAGSALKSVSVPASIAEVGTGAFAGCTILESVTLNEYTIFGSHAFSGCTAMTDVNTAGATKISDAMFSNCPALSDIEPGEFAKVKYIGESAFAGDLALTSVAFGRVLQNIGSEAFACTGLKSADLSGCAPLLEVGDRAFAGCRRLESVTYPAGLREIGTGAFIGCVSLTAASVPETVRTIPDYSYTSVSGVEIADVLHAQVDTIGAYAFKGHDKVVSVSLPSTLEYIGDHAMEGMTGLQTVDAEALGSVPELGEDVWYGVDQPKVELLTAIDLIDAFGSAPQWQDFYIDRTADTEDIGIDGSEGGVQARFVGYELQIRGLNAVIASVALYDTAGHTLYRGDVGSEAVSVDTSAWPVRIYLVSAVLADGTKASIKIARN